MRFVEHCLLPVDT